MRRTTKLAVTAALAALIGLTGCGKDDPKADTSASASPTDDSSSTSTASPTPSPSPSPTQASALSKEHPGRLELVRADVLVAKGPCTAAPTEGLVCSPDGKSYRFDPDRVRIVGVVSARAMPSQNLTSPPAWSIALQFGPTGTRAFAKLTRAAASTHESVLLMIPGIRRVVIAAQVQSEIRDGNVQVSGDYTGARATRIVNLITATAG